MGGISDIRELCFTFEIQGEFYFDIQVFNSHLKLPNPGYLICAVNFAKFVGCLIFLLNAIESKKDLLDCKEDVNSELFMCSFEMRRKFEIIFLDLH